jgi:multicomponent Na+:H+ antiporter subunit B
MYLTVALPLLFLLILTAAGAIIVKDLIGAVFILSTYSFFLALLWAWQGAVDVAFTEAVVGAGVSTIFFLLTLFLTTPDEARTRYYRMSWLVLGGLIALGGLMVYGAQDLPPVGSVDAPANTHISPLYLERSLDETGTPNVVTAVLMDYRALDTLIETTVIFTAGVAASLLLRRRPE